MVINIVDNGDSSKEYQQELSSSWDGRPWPQ